VPNNFYSGLPTSNFIQIRQIVSEVQYADREVRPPDNELILRTLPKERVKEAGEVALETTCTYVVVKGWPQSLVCILLRYGAWRCVAMTTCPSVATRTTTASRILRDDTVTGNFYVNTSWIVIADSRNTTGWTRLKHKEINWKQVPW
jgi:hypothetical protein